MLHEGVDLRRQEQQTLCNQSELQVWPASGDRVCLHGQRACTAGTDCASEGSLPFCSPWNGTQLKGMYATHFSPHSWHWQPWLVLTTTTLTQRVSDSRSTYKYTTLGGLALGPNNYFYAVVVGHAIGRAGGGHRDYFTKVGQKTESRNSHPRLHDDVIGMCCVTLFARSPSLIRPGRRQTIP